MPAANNTVRVTIKVRNDLPANWVNNNPILAMGEFGLEQSTQLIKVGDGSKHWNDLPYLNKVDSRYLIREADGTISLTSDFIDSLDNVITTAGGKTITGPLSIMTSPVGDYDVANKSYVDAAVANAGHLKREIVYELPAAVEAQADTIYMIKDNSILGADKYKEYMLIDNAIVQIGDTSIDLKSLVSGPTTAGNLIMTDNTGALVDTGLAVRDIGKLEPGTINLLGGVKSSLLANYIRITDENDTIGPGFMTLNQVSTSLLYVPDGDTLILEGGTSSGGVITNG